MHTIAGDPCRATRRATRVAADFLDFIASCRCSTGVALHPLKILVSHLPPPVPGGVAPKFGSEKVSRYTGVSQLQLRVSCYTVQLGYLGAFGTNFLGMRPNRTAEEGDGTGWGLVSATVTLLIPKQFPIGIGIGNFWEITSKTISYR